MTEAPREACMDWTGLDWTHAGFEWKTDSAYSLKNGANAGIASSVAKRGRKYIVHSSDYISHWRCSLSSDIVIVYCILILFFLFLFSLTRISPHKVYPPTFASRTCMHAQVYFFGGYFTNPSSSYRSPPGKNPEILLVG